jgi:hypothetical protein
MGCFFDRGRLSRRTADQVLRVNIGLMSAHDRTLLLLTAANSSACDKTSS